MAFGHTTAVIALTGLAFAGPDHYMAWMFAVGAGSGMSAAGVFAFAQTLAGPETAGRWAALQNGFANFAGVLGATLTGYIVDKTAHFSGAFEVTAAIMLLGGIAWVFVVGRLEQEFSRPQPAVRHRSTRARVGADAQACPERSRRVRPALVEDEGVAFDFRRHHPQSGCPILARVGRTLLSDAFDFAWSPPHAVRHPDTLVRPFLTFRGYHDKSGCPILSRSLRKGGHHNRRHQIPRSAANVDHPSPTNL